MTFAVAMWGIFILLGILFKANFYIRMTFICGSFIGYFLANFTFYFPKARPPKLIIRALLLIPTIFFSIVSLTNLVIINFAPLELGPLYIPIFIFMASYVLLASINLFRQFRKSGNLLKLQIKYITIGFLLTFVSGLVTNVLIPLVSKVIRQA